MLFGTITGCRTTTGANNKLKQLTLHFIYSALEGVYFNPNRRLIDGHCSIIVASAQLQSHAGQWTCAGRLIGRNAESSDDFTVNVIGEWQQHENSIPFEFEI